MAMEFVFELFAEMLMEAGFAIGSDRRRNRWIRWAALGLVALFFAAIDLGLLALGIRLLSSEPAAGLAFAVLGCGFTAGSIVMFRNRLK